VPWPLYWPKASSNRKNRHTDGIQIVTNGVQRMEKLSLLAVRGKPRLSRIAKIYEVEEKKAIQFRDAHVCRSGRRETEHIAIDLTGPRKHVFSV
jgi:hypothetical protein